MSEHDFQLGRRELLAYAAMFGPAVAASAQSPAATEPDASIAAAAPHRYAMKKSINLWALPYPDQMTLRRCLEVVAEAGFDGVEINYDLESDVSVKSSEAQLREVAKICSDLGIAISGLCSFLFWPYSLTSNDKERRTKGRQLLKQMIDAAHVMQTQNLLVVPGAVYVPWAPEPQPVPNNVCWDRATEAIGEVVPQAKAANVSMNMENIFANAFLMSPAEMLRFVNQFDQDVVRIHFDTGNIMQFQFPEHWIDEIGPRIGNVHLKEYSKIAGTGFTLESFRPLLDGTTNWPAVLQAFQRCNYQGYLTFEYFHPYPHHPEALVFHTSDALDRMLGRRA